MASIYKTGNGTWRAEIRKRGYPRLIKNFKTKGNAKTWVTDTEYNLNQGTHSNTRKAETTLFLEVANQYLENSARFKRGYQQEIHRVEEYKKQPFANKFMSAIKASDLEKYRDQLFKTRKLKPSTIKRRFTNLRAVFNYAIKSMEMAHLVNPAVGVTLPKVEDERCRIFEGDEETRYFDHAKNFGRGVFADVARFGIETTIRRGEMVGIQEIAIIDGNRVKLLRHSGILWCMVHLDKKIIRLPASVTKTARMRDVPLSPLAIDLIKKQMPVNGKADPQSKVFNITSDGIRNAHARTVKAAGINDFRFHDLRHVGITKWAKKLPMLQVMRVSGHKDPRMLARYYNQDASEIAELMAPPKAVLE